MERKRLDYAQYPPTTALNIGIFLGAATLVIFCLAVANWGWQNNQWIVMFVAAVTFSFFNNTLFSLLHECVHKSFSKKKSVNEFFGVLTAAFFPTGFRVQRRFHFSHHRNNRTDAEMFDMYYPTDHKWLKAVQWYSIFTGFYWLSVPLAAFIYLIWPGFFQLSIFGAQTGAEEMFSSVEQEKRVVLAKLEVIYAFAFQGFLFWSLGLGFVPWLLCYWLFGMNWGALQYADHAWSPRDVREGAWNLSVPKPVRWIFLNYHIHHSHHIYPQLPWYYLGQFKDPAKVQSFLPIYWKMWKGPTLTEQKAPQALTRDVIEEMGV